MYLTQMQLKQLDRATIKTLADIYLLHRVVMKGFVAYATTERVLYRVEPEECNGLISVLVQSQQKPDWSQLTAGNRGVTETRVKEFNPVFANGQRFRFRLRANPTVTRDGKRRGLIQEESLLEWLEKKQERLGVKFSGVTAIDEGYIAGEKVVGDKLHKLSLKIARFEGMLDVIDADSFSTVFSTGIGPAKGFGCGLLSLARV